MARRFAIILFFILGTFVALYVVNSRDRASVFKTAESSTVLSTKNDSQDREEVPETQVTEVASSGPEKAMRARDPRRRKSAAEGSALIDVKATPLESVSLFAGTNWKVWPGVLAISLKEGSSLAGVLGKVSGYYLVKDEEVNDVRSFSSHRPLVVVDSRLEIAGVVTGVFSVVLKEGVSSDFLKNASGLKIVHEFPEIRTYYVTSLHEPFDLTAFQESLKAQPEIEKVQIEILSRQYEKY
ncbi:MAG: hypothetical protein KUL82_02330 [Bdellovibrio sp.]|nr:hypothetical protein [Bdellovibrio sp.]